MASIEHPTAIAASAIVAFRTALAQTETATLTDAERIELVTEWTARLVAEAAADLDPRQRYELDERLGPDLPRLSSRQARVAAQRIVADIDADVVRRRMDRARRGRRLSMRVVGDGMAYLSILAPMTEVAGAHASLKQHALSVVAGTLEGESTTGRDGRLRGMGAIMSDAALERLTGRAVTEAQPVSVNIVMTDRALLRWGEQSCTDEEPALIPDLGPVPASFARELLADPQVEAFYRRLFTSPDGRDLVAMDSRARFFPAGLRLMIALRDQHCRTPYCDAPIAQIDHVVPHAAGGPTGYRNGMGLCQRCNLTKESPGYRGTVRPSAPDPPTVQWRSAGRVTPEGTGRSGTSRVTVDRAGPHLVELTTPSDQRVTSLAPPLLGWGWRAPPDADQAPAPAPNESRAERVLRLALAA